MCVTAVTPTAAPKAELVEVLLCSALTSGIRRRIPAKMIVYRTPTSEMQRTIHRGTNTISQGQVMSLQRSCKTCVHDGDNRCRPVQFECQEDELQDVDRAEQLQLEGSVVPHAPDADRDGDDADEDEGHEHLREQRGSYK